MSFSITFTATVRANNSPINILLRMAQSPDDFFLTQLTIDSKPGITGCSGCFASGQPGYPASRTIDLEPTLFNALSTHCLPQTTVTVTVVYDINANGMICIESIDCRAQIQVRALAVLNTISRQIGEGPVTQEIQELKRIAMEQLEVQRETLAFLRQERAAPFATAGDLANGETRLT